MSKSTSHKFLFQNAKHIAADNESVDLVVTSPPYPMIEMWDEVFFDQNKKIKKAFDQENFSEAYELMHKEMDLVWSEIFRLIKPGGIVCINIGDATRTLNKNFRLFPNHSRIIEGMLQLGFQNLPNIIWRKQTNAPNKFMGSGMLPPGAYVTLEHEFILIFRKAEKRSFNKEQEKANRQASSYFWEERNSWFSDLWDIKGTSQKLTKDLIRTRSAAYPFEVPYRLINMFSVKGDVVLDPFVGTGTTTLAAIATQRNSIGVDIDGNFIDVITEQILNKEELLNNYIQARIDNHRSFITNRKLKKGGDCFKHYNNFYDFEVMTRQEKMLQLPKVKNIKPLKSNDFTASYKG